MRVVVQRVSAASVSVAGEIEASIGRGLLVLWAAEPDDQSADLDWLAGKVANLRVFDDASGVMNLGIKEAGGDVLLVSQFTLFASTGKGNRPSYSRAARPEVAVPLYESFQRRLAELLGKPVATGVFGADMKVSLVNDGPVTIIIDSRLRE